MQRATYSILAAMRLAARLRSVRRSIALVVACACALAAPARAHPHVWVTMTAELLYGPNGAATGVRHRWTFDDMFSAFATTGIKAKTKGRFTRQELAPLAQVNMDSLKEYGYFTRARVDGKRQKDAFEPPRDYWLEYDPKETVLTLHFTLPFKHPVAAKQLAIEIYDPEFFVDLAFADKNAVTLVGAPAQCAVQTHKSNDDNFPPMFQRLDRSFVSSEANVGMGFSFANKILVTCP